MLPNGNIRWVELHWYEAQGFEELARLTRDTKIGARYYEYSDAVVDFMS
jgi:hypothetical protein